MSGVTSLASLDPSFTHCTRNLSLQSAGGQRRQATWTCLVLDAVRWAEPLHALRQARVLAVCRAIASEPALQQLHEDRKPAASTAQLPTSVCLRRCSSDARASSTSAAKGSQACSAKPAACLHSSTTAFQQLHCTPCLFSPQLPPARTCQGGRVLALRLHNDLHLLAAARLNNAAAGPHAVLLGAGRLDLRADTRHAAATAVDDAAPRRSGTTTSLRGARAAQARHSTRAHLERHPLPRRVLQRQRARHILAELKPGGQEQRQEGECSARRKGSSGSVGGGRRR